MINPQNDEQARFKAMQAFPAHLTAFEWTQLRTFLVKPGSKDEGQLEQVLKNELMDALCAQSPPPEDLGDVLSGIYRDQNQNDVIRDYAVQHLAAYFEKATLQSDSEKSLQSVQSTLWEAAANPKGSLGGTALLALNRLSQEYPARFDQSQIAVSALRMAQNSIVGELTHITAFQICAQLKVADALPVVLQAARIGETIPTRLSAIAALGVLGGEQQVAFLNEIMQGDQERLKPAAQHALDLIRSHNNQANSRK